MEFYVLVSGKLRTIGYGKDALTVRNKFFKKYPGYPVYVGHLDAKRRQHIKDFPKDYGYPY